MDYLVNLDTAQRYLSNFDSWKNRQTCVALPSLNQQHEELQLNVKIRPALTQLMHPVDLTPSTTGWASQANRPGDRKLGGLVLIHWLIHCINTVFNTLVTHLSRYMMLNKKMHSQCPDGLICEMGAFSCLLCQDQVR